MRTGIVLADQILAALLFVSYLILVLAWRFSGPITAAILSGLSAIILIYLGLATREPWLFLQALSYGAMYFVMASFLYEIQKRVNDKKLNKERLDEETHLANEDFARQEELEKAIHRRINRFLDLHQFAETLKGIPTLQDVAHRVVEEAHALVPHAEGCVLYLVDTDRQMLSLLSSRQPKGFFVSEPHGSELDQWVMKRARALIIEDSFSDFRFSLPSEEAGHLRSVCICPLMTENKVLGVLRVNSHAEKAFSSDDLHALDIISGLAAVFFRNRLLYDRMEELAIQDALTGLYLRRYFKERLSEEIIRAKIKPTEFSLILMDVDYFKNYNDEFGHTAGDSVLKNIAKVLMRYSNPADVAARYGGEEFVLLLANKGKQEAMLIAEEIRAQIEATKVILRRMEQSVTVSIGVASYPLDAQKAEELIKVADKRLYFAKNEGRNQVCGNISS